MSKSYRVGVIGLGRVADLLGKDPLRKQPCTHVGAWLAQPGVEVVAGCDLKAQRREKFAGSMPDSSVYEDYREMLARENLDFVTICAYASERAEMVVAAADAGVRGIWCEKAMASSLQECDAIEAALARNQTKMIVSYMRRWSPLYLQAKALLDEGAIGRLESINVHFSGNMLHTGTHAFDCMRLIAGEVEAAQAWLQRVGARVEQSGYRFGGEDYVEDFGGFAVLYFANGVKGTVHGDDKEYFRFELELLGSEGMMRIGNTQRELWRIADSDNYTGFKELRPETFPEVVAGNSWVSACAELIAAAETGAPLSCDQGDGQASLRLALALHESDRRGNVLLPVGDVPARLRVKSR